MIIHSFYSNTSYKYGETTTFTTAICEVATTRLRLEVSIFSFSVKSLGPVTGLTNSKVPVTYIVIVTKCVNVYSKFASKASASRKQSTCFANYFECTRLSICTMLLVFIGLHYFTKGWYFLL